MLCVYVLSLLSELFLTMPYIWSGRVVVVGLVIGLTGFSSAGLFMQYPGWLGAGVVLLAIFRIFNLLRVAKGRMHTDYLKKAVRRTSLRLLLYHVALVALWAVGGPVAIKVHMYVGVVFVISAITLLVTLRNIAKTRHVPVSEHYADKDLPTVTVAVPARNETIDLEDMIRTVIANNYPKLEVIVLDDSSSGKTSEIIRQFAQDGVRFVPGHEPEQRWLAKNLAYEKLAEEASGELILFAGVDVRLGPEAIRSLVTTLLNRKKSMISVLPRRLTGSAKDAFVQPMRYWWELALPRRLFNRPAVLSTCWLIKRKALKKLGGFGAVSHAIIPEGYFARELIKKDGYSFIRADDLLDIQTRKNPAEQLATTVRMRYPQLRRRPEGVLLATVINIGVLLLPFGIAISSFWAGLDAVHILAALACLLLVATHLSIIQVSNPSNSIVALVNLPLAALSELMLTLASMYQYEFSVVEWKGRNITTPVMHVYPRLPA